MCERIIVHAVDKPYLIERPLDTADEFRRLHHAEFGGRRTANEWDDMYQVDCQHIEHNILPKDNLPSE